MMEKEIEQQQTTSEEHSESQSLQLSGKHIVWIAIAVLLVLQAGLYWLWMQQNSVNKTLEQKIVAAIPEPVDVTGLERQLKQQLSAQMKQQFETLESSQRTMAQELEQLKQNQQMTRADIEFHWALKEIEYLLTIANQRALLAKDAKGALTAIKLADMRVAMLSDQRLHPLRGLLADEELALKSVKIPDIEGIAWQLEALVHRVDKLQLVHAPPVNKKQTETDHSEKAWKGVLGRAWQEVKSLVVIRHQQNGSAAVLVPEQRYFLYQNLRLKLQAARLALLLGQTQIYKDSLKAAQSWLTQYFTGDTRDAMIDSLADLEQKNITVVLPDISASLTWIRGFKQ